MRSIMNALARLLRATRPENWWFSKAPPLLAVAYLEIARRGAESGRDALLLGCFVLSISMVAAYGHIVNDACDVETDRRAGKPDHMAGASCAQRFLLCALFLLAGFAPAWPGHYTALTLLVLALNYLWPTVYSLPPLRLKERGMAGLACDALGSHVTPTLLALTIFALPPPGPPGLMFPLGILAWAATLGIKGILHHQIADRASDLSSGTVTFATTRSRPERLVGFLTWFNLGAELPVSAAVVAATWSWAPIVAVAFAGYCIVELVKYRLGFEFALAREPWANRRSLPFINESIYVIWLPFAAAAQLAANVPVFSWVPLFHILAFYPTIALQRDELKAVIQVAHLPSRLARRAR
jgi:4-hydroxybenzoate polyprenyltransferase